MDRFLADWLARSTGGFLTLLNRSQELEARGLGSGLKALGVGMFLNVFDASLLVKQC